jgi:hypothetical protein
MWIKADGTSVTTYSWFMPEIQYMLSELIDRKIADPIYATQLLLDAINLDTWVGKTTASKIIDYQNISHMLKWKPLSHQQEYLERFEYTTTKYELKGGLIGFAAGLGKSYTALAIAEGLHIERIFVLCPKSAITDPWVESTQTLYRHPQHKVWTVLDRHKPHNNDRFLIFNYAYLNKIEEDIKGFSKRKTLIVLDESHNLNEVKARQTQLYMEFAKKHGDYIVHLSGTPLKATTTELLPVLAVTDPRFTGEVILMFERMFKRTNNQDMIDLMRNRIQRVSYIVEKKVLRLRDPITVVHEVTIPNGDKYTLPNVKIDMEVYAKQRLEIHTKNRPEAIITFNRLVDSVDHPNMHDYKDYIDDVDVIMDSNSYMHISERMKRASKYERDVIIPRLSNEDKRTFRSIRAIAKYPKLKVLGETLGNVLGRARIECNIDIARHLNYSDIIGKNIGKSLIFSNHVDAINTAARALEKQSYHPVLIYGDVIHELPEIIKSFRDDKDVNPLLATYASLATAVPLTMVSDVVVLDSPFRDYVLTQAIARAHRLGNENQVYVHYIILKTDEPNVNDRSLDLAEFSGDAVAEILGIDPNVEYPDRVAQELIT